MVPLNLWSPSIPNGATATRLRTCSAVTTQCVLSRCAVCVNVLCAFTPQFYGRGPNFFDRRYVWPYGGIIVGTDPVAVDAVGAHLLSAKRVAFFGEDRPLDVSPKHIEAADRKYSLGTSDLRRIDLVKIGWTEDVLM